MSVLASHARPTKILVNEFDVSQCFKELDLSGEVEVIDATTFDNPSKQYVVGLTDGKASLKGLFSAKDAPGDADEIDDLLQPILGVDTDQLVTIGQSGLGAVAGVVSLFKCKQSKYSVQSPSNNLISVMAELQSVSGIRTGRVLAPLTARTATGTGTSIDNAAATSNGAHVHLHVTAASASDSLTVVIEDSADNSAWATIGTFTAATAEGSQRLELTGTVRRYVRARWTITGTGPSFTFAVALARLF